MHLGCLSAVRPFCLDLKSGSTVTHASFRYPGELPASVEAKIDSLVRRAGVMAFATFVRPVPELGDGQMTCTSYVVLLDHPIDLEAHRPASIEGASLGQSRTHHYLLKSGKGMLLVVRSSRVLLTNMCSVGSVTFWQGLHRSFTTTTAAPTVSDTGANNPVRPSSSSSSSSTCMGDCVVGDRL